MSYKVYKFNVIEGLESLASYDFQKIAWFENNQGIVSSFEIMTSLVFEASALEVALYKQVVFSQKADIALRELNELVENIGYNKDERELINSPEMEIVRQKAAEALVLVIASDGSESTVEIVEE